jgi:hypothetical protein
MALKKYVVCEGKTLCGCGRLHFSPPKLKAAAAASEQEGVKCVQREFSFLC